jgi:heterogeneous nuclear rnp K-like protein 2
MSASPTIVASSTKRPLEEPSSPAGPNDQPDAKRPALDKMVKDEPEDIDTALPVKAESMAADNLKSEDAKPDLTVEETSVVQNGTEEPQADTHVPDAPPAFSMPADSQPILDTQPIQSTSGANGRPASQSQHQDETNWLHLRACIGTSEAATIIGKGGENVTQIRRLSGAKCTVSDYARGAVERILTVSGQVDAVSKVSNDGRGVLGMRSPISMASYSHHSHPGSIHWIMLTSIGFRTHCAYPQSRGP